MERNILVIGGNSGVGNELIKQLAAKGDHVIAGARDDREISKVSGVTFHPFDALDRGATLNLPEKLDGVVYCPGTIQLKPFHRVTDEDFDQELQVNFFGAINVIRQALPALKKSESASVVLFSTVAVDTGIPFHSGISSAKGALEGLMRTMAAEFAPDIRVNCLALSLTDTALAANLLSTEEKRKASAQRHPMKRIGDPAEVAQAAGFLLGKDSGFMTGQVMKIDGGISTIKIL
ncbi:SDR family oxidoreductase [Verrucomicrobiales bacterium]|nr:SDR family oxidoreductase [Verrucomicrobiales bacterium]|tara:strand:+ start:400 stop:1101 length:702 start_codon:yes stop_codon:yes gene_type:complete